MDTFAVLAEPNRRMILDRLAVSPASVNELVTDLSLSQPSVSKHLRVLREAEFVRVTPLAQRRVYQINVKPFQEVDNWLTTYRKFWSQRFDALEEHLEKSNRRAK